MKLLVHKGKTSKRVFVFVQDSSKTTGAGLTGLSSSSSGLVCYRAREDDGNAGATQLTLSAGTRGTWSSGGFVEKDSTNQPGVYELGLDNAGLATGSDTVVYYLQGATNMAPVVLEVQLVDFDPQNGTSLGLADLDAAVSSRLASSSYTAPPTTAQIAAAILVTPANLLASDGSGRVTLAPAGLDPVTVESGLNARQALAISAAALAGTLAGAAGTSVTIAGAGVATNRITATVDSSGNRTAVTLSPPA